MPDSPFYNENLFTDYGLIFDKCIDLYEVISICLKVTTSNVCVKLKLAGFGIDEKCVRWERNGPTLLAIIDFAPINAGIWKLSGIKLEIKHDLNTNDGGVSFEAALYKLNGFPPTYTKQRQIKQEIASW